MSTSGNNNILFIYKQTFIFFLFFLFVIFFLFAVLGSGVDRSGNNNTNSSSEDEIRIASSMNDSNTNNSVHQIKANERINALEHELNLYKEREIILQNLLSNDPKAQKSFGKVLKKNGVEESSVCTMM